MFICNSYTNNNNNNKNIYDIKTGTSADGQRAPFTGPCQSWPPNNPHPLDWLYLSLLSTCSCCVVSALAPLYCGCRRIIQVDAAHWWWWLRTDPPPPPPPPHDCKALWVYGNTQ